MNIKPLAAALLVSFPVGCETADAPVSLGGPDACGASALQELLGQDSSVLQTMDLSEPFRVIRPGDAVTMDFNPHRLNIDLDGAGLIATVRCG